MRSRTKLQLFAILFVYSIASVQWVVAERDTETSKTFKVKKGADLVIEADNSAADIRVKVWSKNEIHVRVDGLHEQDLEDLDMSQSGNTVTVEYYPGGRWGGRRHVRFVVNVPSETSLELATSGGDIEVDGRIKGMIEAGTSGGDVEVDEVEGDVELATSGGDIGARYVKGDAELKTSGGDIEVGNVDGRLNAATAGGDIIAGRVGKDVRAATAGGDIEIGDVGGEASVATAGGDVIIGNVMEAASLKTAGGDIECESARGFVKAQTAGGDIELAKVTGYLEAETAGGDIIVTLIPNETRGSNIETKGGDIELFLPAKSKVTIDARIRIYNGGRHWGDDDDYDDDEYDVYSDFKALSHDRDRRGVRAKFELNGGGKTISLETSNGNIEIRKIK